MIKRFIISIFVFALVQNLSFSACWEEVQAINNKKAFVDTESINIIFPKMYYKIKYEKDDFYYIFDMVSIYDKKTTKILSIDKYDLNDKFIATKEKDYYGKPSFYDKTKEEIEEEVDPIPVKSNSVNEAVYSKISLMVKANKEKSDLMTSVLTPVSIIKKEALNGDNNLQITLKVKNTQDKPIIGFEGDIDVYDALNNKLLSLKVKSDNNIKKQSIKSFNYVWDINSNINLFKIYNRKTSDLDFVFNPTKIIFDDGTSL